MTADAIPDKVTKAELRDWIDSVVILDNVRLPFETNPPTTNIAT